MKGKFAVLCVNKGGCNVQFRIGMLPFPAPLPGMHAPVERQTIYSLVIADNPFY